MDRKIGGIFIEIAAKGADRFRAVLTSLKTVSAETKEKLNLIADTAQKVGDKLRNAFAFGTAGIGGFLAASDPGGLQMLALKALDASRAVGQIFTPLVAQVATAIDWVRDFFAEMDNGTRATILGWVETAAIIGGTLFALTKIVTIGRTLIAVFTGFRALLAAINISLGPIGWIALALGAAAAAFGVYKAVRPDETKTEFKGSGPINRQFLQMGDLFKQLNTATGGDIPRKQLDALEQIAQNTAPKTEEPKAQEFFQAQFN